MAMEEREEKNGFLLEQRGTLTFCVCPSLHLNGKIYSFIRHNVKKVLRYRSMHLCSTSLAQQRATKLQATCYDKRLWPFLWILLQLRVKKSAVNKVEA